MFSRWGPSQTKPERDSSKLWSSKFQWTILSPNSVPLFNTRTTVGDGIMARSHLTKFNTGDVARWTVIKSEAAGVPRGGQELCTGKRFTDFVVSDPVLKLGLAFLKAEGVNNSRCVGCCRGRKRSKRHHNKALSVHHQFRPVAPCKCSPDVNLPINS